MVSEKHTWMRSAAGQAVACEDHRAFIFLPFRLAPGPGSDLRSAADVLHRALATAPAGAKMPRWRKLERTTAGNELHQDLLPVLDQLLHGGSESADDSVYHGHAPLRLNLEGLPQAYLLEFRKAALRRLASAGVEATAVLVKLRSATLYTFATGVVIVSVSLEFGEPHLPVASCPAALLLEALYAIGHAADRGNTLHPVEADRRVLKEDLAPGDRIVLDKEAQFSARRWQPEDGEPMVGPTRPRRLLSLQPVSAAGIGQATARGMLFESGEPADLVDIVKGWLPPADEALLQPARSAAHGRLFTFFVGLYEAGLSNDALSELAFRMSRRHGADYNHSPGAIDTAVLRTFDNVCHASATQGAAIAVRSSGSDFIEGFVDSAVKPAYLPMALVNYHEYIHLLHLTQGIAWLPNAGQPRADKERLQQMRAELIAFRLYFRFVHISDLDHHNQVHNLWRQALDLDHMLQNLTLDVREGEQVLERLHMEDEEERRRLHDREQEKRSKFWRKWGIIGLGFGQIYLLMHIFELVVELIYPRKWMTELMVQANPGGGAITPEVLARTLHTYHTAHSVEIVLSVIAAAVGVWLGWVAYKSGSGGSGH